MPPNVPTPPSEPKPPLPPLATPPDQLSYNSKSGKTLPVNSSEASISPAKLVKVILISLASAIPIFFFVGFFFLVFPGFNKDTGGPFRDLNTLGQVATILVTAVTVFLIGRGVLRS